MKATDSFLSALLDDDHLTDVFVADKILFIQSESRPTKQQRAELEYFFNASLTVPSIVILYFGILIWNTFLKYFLNDCVTGQLCLTNTCAKISQVVVGVRVNKIFP